MCLRTFLDWFSKPYIDEIPDDPPIDLNCRKCIDYDGTIKPDKYHEYAFCKHRVCEKALDDNLCSMEA